MGKKKRTPPQGLLGYPRIVEWTWATHEGLRRLGFEADEIFVSTESDGEVVVRLFTQGKEFNMRIDGLRGLPKEEFERIWPEFADKFNKSAFDEEKLFRILDSWLALVGGAVPFVTAIMAKGIRLPRGDNVPIVDPCNVFALGRRGAAQA